MDNTGRPSYVFQFFCAPGTPVEQTRPPGQLQLLTQPAAAEPARYMAVPLAPVEEGAALLHHHEALTSTARLVSPSGLGTPSASAIPTTT